MQISVFRKVDGKSKGTYTYTVTTTTQHFELIEYAVGEHNSTVDGHPHAVAGNLRRSGRQKKQDWSVETNCNIILESLLANGLYCNRSISKPERSTAATDPYGPYRQSTSVDYSVPGPHCRIELVRWPPRGHSCGRHASYVAACRRGRLTKDGRSLSRRGCARWIDQAGRRQLRCSGEGVDCWTVDNGTLRLRSFSREGKSERTLRSMVEVLWRSWSIVSNRILVFISSSS